MKRNFLLVIPFSLGLTLLALSWYLSYPLSVNSVSDLVFNHVSVFYWISLPLLFTSMYLIAAMSTNKILKWVMAVGFVLLLYSLYYFCYTLPGSDSHYFRGLTEYYIKTGNLDPSQPLHSYFQFPSFFILANIATSISGIPLTNYEFLQFSIIGFLLVTALFVYASKLYKKGGFLVPIVLFIAMFYFIDYQNVPFALASGLLFILFALDTLPKSSGILATMVILFVSISITHAFVPLFFVIYLLIQSIIKRNKAYVSLFLITLAIYLGVQVTLSWSSFLTSIQVVLGFQTEYGSLVGGTFAPISTQIDAFAQLYSRFATIGAIAVSLFGFLFLIIKRKLQDSDKSVILTGMIWSGIGLVIYTLGSRTFPIIFISISLGAAYLFESKFRKYIVAVFLILLVLVVSIPVHNSLTNPPMMFQTKEAYNTAGFLIDRYNWNANSVVLSDGNMAWFVSPQVENRFDHYFTTTFNSSEIGSYNCVIYSVLLGKSIPNTQSSNASVDAVSQQFKEKFDVVYDSGSYYVATQNGN